MMFINFYRLLLKFVKFVFTFTSYFLPKAIQEWFQLRNTATERLNDILISQSENIEKSIWFHAASGEIEYVKGVIREIRAISPQRKIVLTYSSASAERLLFNIKDEVDLILPLPWDDAKSIQKLIRVIQPQLLVFAKTDFWPELIFQMEKQNLPMSVVSFTLLRKNRLNTLTAWALPKMKSVLCADSTTQTTLSQYKINSEVFGDTRFDQVFFRLSQEPKIELKNPSSSPLLVLASTWEADDQVFLTCATELIQKGFKIIWCPHDVGSDRVKGLIQKISKLGSFAIHKLSEYKTKQIELSAQILIIDQVGFLADVYRYSTFTFVGGSFDRRVHSVMEPLCAGNMVFVGPHYKNNLEAVDFMQIGLIQNISNGTDFMAKLIAFDASTVSKNRNEILRLCTEKRGAAKKIAQNLLRVVTNPP